MRECGPQKTTQKTNMEDVTAPLLPALRSTRRILQLGPVQSTRVMTVLH